MLKLTFTNAQVEDHGFGLIVNGRDLDDIISTALGTRVGNIYGHNSGLPAFKSNCCNVTVTIEPKPVAESIETDAEVWFSVDDMEKNKREQYKEKAGEE
jgi:hypothetical protein